MENEPLDQVLRTVMSREDGGTAGECPDDNRIAAYFDGALVSDERAALESHFAGCSSCRKVLALSMQLTGDQSAANLQQTETGRRVLFHFRIPVAALALVAATVIAGTVYYRIVRTSTQPPSPAQTAELRLPAPVVSQPRAPAPLPASPAAPPPAGKQMPQDEKRIAALRPRPKTTEASDAASEKDYMLREPGLKTEEAQALKIRPAAIPEAETPQGQAANTVNAPAPKESAGVSAGRDVLMLRARSVAAMPSDNAARPGAAVTRIIGDRTFTRVTGVWVDDECAKHPDAPAIELKPDSGEFGALLEAYPGLGELRPFVVFWQGKKVSVR